MAKLPNQFTVYIDPDDKRLLGEFLKYKDDNASRFFRRYIKKFLQTKEVRKFHADRK